MKLKKLTIDIEVAQILADASNVEKGRQFSKLLRAMSCGEARADDPGWVREAIGRAVSAQRGFKRGAELTNGKRRGFGAMGTTLSDTPSDTPSVTPSDTPSVTPSAKPPKPPEKLARAGSLFGEKSKNLSNSPLHVPPSSLPGMAEGAAAAEEPAATQLLRDRLGMLFRRRPTTRWNDAEKRVLRSIAKRPGVEDELAEIERLYRSGYKFKRKDIKTLLNNWTGELDRARGYFAVDERSFAEQVANG